MNLDGLTHWLPGNAVPVRELVLAYHDVFTLEGNELGCTSAIKHEICIENSEPFKEQFRCILPPLLEEVCASLQDMLEAGAICPSQSLWCNAMVLVRKKDGTLHFCVDFRLLNMWMKKDSYPLPRIQEALESKAGSAHFSSMDFKSGFWQIKMALESQQYTAFTVGNLRFYKFTHMPFELCNVLVTFQHLMQNTLGELNLMYCMIYLDNVIVFGRVMDLKEILWVTNFLLYVLRVVQSILMNYWTIRIGQIFVGYNYIVFPLLGQRQYSLTNVRGYPMTKYGQTLGIPLDQIRSG